MVSAQFTSLVPLLALYDDVISIILFASYYKPKRNRPATNRLHKPRTA